MQTARPILCASFESVLDTQLGETSVIDLPPTRSITAEGRFRARIAMDEVVDDFVFKTLGDLAQVECLGSS